MLQEYPVSAYLLEMVILLNSWVKYQREAMNKIIC